MLLPGEKTEELGCGGYRIIQKSGGFRFGMDAVLLSGFVRKNEAGRIVDLGTGTGILPILLRAKTLSRDITGLEIQADMCDLASRSVKLNGLERDIHIINGDIKEAAELLGKGAFDAAVSNPPYIAKGSGLLNPESGKAIARHEIKCTFEDVAGQAAALLKEKGRFYLVHRPERLAQITETLRKSGLEPKRLRTVHSFRKQDACLFLLEAIKGAGCGMKVESPLIVYKTTGVYTEEIQEIYGLR